MVDYDGLASSAIAGVIAAASLNTTSEEPDVVTRCPRVTASYPADVVRVVDGDTIDVELELGFDVVLSARLRLMGLDAPEIHSVPKSSDEYARGEAARQFVQSWVDGYAGEVIVEAEERGKYGRIVAVVHPPGTAPPSAISLNAELIKSRHAAPKVYR